MSTAVQGLCMYTYGRMSAMRIMVDVAVEATVGVVASFVVGAVDSLPYFRQPVDANISGGNLMLCLQV